MNSRITFPEGKSFAFTVFDDTDHSTLANTPRMYRFLRDKGFRTTKSVWPIAPSTPPRVGGSTCAESSYLKWAQTLQQEGFEIALHNVSSQHSKREEIIEGLEAFRKQFGQYPAIQVNHAECNDCVYWGDQRLTGLNKLAYNILTRFANRGFQGCSRDSPYFWGDLLQEHVQYVRQFVFTDINTLKACPFMPYHDPERPYVKHWFASSEGANCASFCRTLREDQQDRLEAEGGVCIMYTHFGADDFYLGNELDPEFSRLMTMLSKRNGWFVPVSTQLDHLITVNGEHQINSLERFCMEVKWLFQKVFFSRGTT